MSGTAGEIYEALVAANEAQSQRLGTGGSGPSRWDAAAQRFRQDPRRALDDTLETILFHLEPNDILIDVGGGAGRYSLPLALRCREVINVEPSAGMGEQFEASASEAGIRNARWLKADWLSAPDLMADVTLVANVTYFVREIVPFLEKLAKSSRRRVLILVNTVPPPNQGADIFRIIRGEEQALLPSYRELLPVLWDMGILPDVQVLGSGDVLRAPNEIYSSREEAIASILVRRGTMSDPDPRAVEKVAAAFDELFVSTPDGFQRRAVESSRLMLISWPPTKVRE